jgi:hypothetical protein
MAKSSDSVHNSESSPGKTPKASEEMSHAQLRSQLEAARQRVRPLVKEALDADRQPSKALNLRLK